MALKFGANDFGSVMMEENANSERSARRPLECARNRAPYSLTPVY